MRRGGVRGAEGGPLREGARGYGWDGMRRAGLRTVDSVRPEAADEDYTAAWNRFFWGPKGIVEPGKDQPVRGFHWYYPVDNIQPGSTVLATFAGPPESRIKINDGLTAASAQFPARNTRSPNRSTNLAPNTPRSKPPMPCGSATRPDMSGE